MSRIRKGASAGVFELAVAIRYDDADIYGPIGLEIYFRLDTHRTLGLPHVDTHTTPMEKTSGLRGEEIDPSVSDSFLLDLCHLRSRRLSCDSRRKGWTLCYAMYQVFST